jgi:hypothetical protein
VQNYHGVTGPVRRKVSEVSSEAYARFLKGDSTAIPHWMQIRDGDTEKQREKKLRALKAFKKKMRCACLPGMCSELAPATGCWAAQDLVMPLPWHWLGWCRVEYELFRVCRFELKDMQSTKQANDWKSFMSGKGTKKKAGFMTGAKKESMFAVPQNPNSKVGVIGSGRGMTNAPTKRSRLDF